MYGKRLFVQNNKTHYFKARMETTDRYMYIHSSLVINHSTAVWKVVYFHQRRDFSMVSHFLSTEESLAVVSILLNPITHRRKMASRNWLEILLLLLHHLLILPFVQWPNQQSKVLAPLPLMLLETRSTLSLIATAKWPHAGLHVALTWSNRHSPGTTNLLLNFASLLSPPPWLLLFQSAVLVQLPPISECFVMPNN